MHDYFKKTNDYLQTLNLGSADPLDQKIAELIKDEKMYERPSQALRRRFVRGAEYVEGMDRGGRLTRIKREKVGGKFKYHIEGEDGSWNSPEERIWVVAMYALWQDSKEK